jgi:hypothetical protein
LVALTASHPDAALQASRTADWFTVSWPGSLAGFRLQSTTNLAGAVLWSDVSTVPALVQGRAAVTNDMSDLGRFYRLTK